MAYQYKVQRFTIDGEVLTTVFTDSSVASIIIQLSEAEKKSEKLVAKIFAADNMDRQIMQVAVNWENWRSLSLANPFIERKIYITREMFEEVLKDMKHGRLVTLKIEHMRFTPKKFRYTGQDHPGDRQKDFMAYSVFIKRKKEN